MVAFAQTNLSQGGTGLNSSSAGDLLVGTSSTLRYSKLPKGTAGQVLMSTASAPFFMAWTSTSSLGFVDLINNQTIAGNKSFTGTTNLTEWTATNGTSSVLTVNTMFHLVAGLHDSTHNIGSSGQYLQSTGTSTLWTTLSFISLGSLSATYPIIYNSGTGVFSTGFSTSTVNVFSAKQTFDVASATGMTATNLYSGNTAVTGTLTQSGGAVTLATTTTNGDLTLTGVRVVRVVPYTSSSTITVDIRTTDIATTTINQTTAFANPLGTPFNGQMFEIWGRATTSQTISWGTQFASSTDLNNITTVASGTTKWLFEYRQDSGKWELMGLLKQFVN